MQIKRKMKKEKKNGSSPKKYQKDKTKYQHLMNKVLIKISLCNNKKRPKLEIKRRTLKLQNFNKLDKGKRFNLVQIEI